MFALKNNTMLALLGIVTQHGVKVCSLQMTSVNLLQCCFGVRLKLQVDASLAPW
jgi:hypothetical protein